MKKQQGSAHVVIIIALVLALIGALGFIFWQNFINKDTTTNKNSVAATEKKTDVMPKKTESKTFSIKEYAVKFKVPTALTDTTINYESRQIGEASFLAFTTQRVVDLGGDCAGGYPFGDLVTLSRDNQSTTSEYQVYTSEKIGSYYYHIATVESSGLSPASTCAVDAQAKADLNNLVSSLKTIVQE